MRVVKRDAYVATALAVDRMHLPTLVLVPDDLLVLESHALVVLEVDLVKRVDRLLARPKYGRERTSSDQVDGLDQQQTQGTRTGPPRRTVHGPCRLNSPKGTSCLRRSRLC